MLLTEFVDMYKKEGTPANSKLLQTTVKLEDLFNAVSSINELAGSTTPYSTADKTVIGISIKAGNNSRYGIIYDKTLKKWRAIIEDWYNITSNMQTTSSMDVTVIPQVFMEINDVEAIPASAWRDLYSVIVAKTADARDVFYVDEDAPLESAEDITDAIKASTGDFTFRIFMATYDASQDCILNNFKTLKFDSVNMVKVPEDEAKAMFDYNLTKNNGHYVVQYVWHSWFNTDAAHKYRPYVDYIPVPEVS